MKVERYPVTIDESVLLDLRARLDRTRWPSPPPRPGSGLSNAPFRALMQQWSEDYDWRRCEREINEVGSFVFELDGVAIHLLHARSSRPDATPLVLTHGWPGSILEFLDVVPKLTEPGAASPAFHVVIPSLPGFGFSSKPRERGWGVERIADAWNILMRALGYDRYIAQGGDWGAEISLALLERHRPSCVAAHVNFLAARPPSEVVSDPTQEEAQALADLARHHESGSAYARLQATRPHTLAHALVDSPVGMAAWILEKFEAWTDGEAYGTISFARLLDNLTLWWVTASAGSAAQLYRESYFSAGKASAQGPTGLSVFPREIARPSQRWARSRLHDLIHYQHLDAGGHFPALEQPIAFVQQLRTFRTRLAQTHHV